MNNKFYLKKNYNNNVLAWDIILNNFNESVKKNALIKYNPIGFFVSHDAHDISKLKPVLKDLKCNVAHLYFNIATSGETFGNHKDTTDVWFWNCQGKTKWIIENKEQFILEPGDLIFVKKGIFHNAIPLTPRAGISMSKE